jgi:exodeoxyribonuclease VII small subunit
MTSRKPRVAAPLSAAAASTAAGLPGGAPSTSDEADTPDTVTASSFEDAMRRLTHIVEDLEGGELSLEESLARFEEGVRLARASQARLDAAEARVEELMRIDEKGNPVVRDLDADA